MPQLDGLRALAVSAVIAEHFHLTAKGAEYGVHLFFVLSGFLITGILMKSRDAVDSGAFSWKQAFRQFYVRRALRIFPLYYLVLLVAIALNVRSAIDNAAWLFTYTINFKMGAQGWYIPSFAHFWSLAIEEQYYLVWPFLILLLPRRRLVPAALVLIAIGPLFRLLVAVWWAYFSTSISPINTYIATPTAFDSLGMGSLISIVLSVKPVISENRRLIAAASISMAVLLAASIVVDAWWWVFPDTVTAIFFGWLIYRASMGFGGIPGKILAAAPVVYIGQISYGIYVFHPLIPDAAYYLARTYHFSLPEGLPGVTLFVALTLVIATVSGFSFERPLNNLKNRLAPPVKSPTDLQ